MPVNQFVVFLSSGRWLSVVLLCCWLAVPFSPTPYAVRSFLAGVWLQLVRSQTAFASSASTGSCPNACSHPSCRLGSGGAAREPNARVLLARQPALPRAVAAGNDGASNNLGVRCRAGAAAHTSLSTHRGGRCRRKRRGRGCRRAGAAAPAQVAGHLGAAAALGVSCMEHGAVRPSLGVVAPRQSTPTCMAVCLPRLCERCRA